MRATLPLTLFSSEADAPLSMSILTTSKWPPSVAMCSGVESVILFRAWITTDLSNFINSSSTPTEPLAAAMCAHVLPF